MTIDSRAAIAVLATLGLLLLSRRADFAIAASPPSVGVTFDKGDTQLDTVKAGVKFLSNRMVTLAQIPAELNGLTFTRRPYNVTSAATLEVPAGTAVYILLLEGNSTAKTRDFITANGWKKIDDGKFDGQLTSVCNVYKRVFTSATSIKIPGSSTINFEVAAKNILLLDNGQTPKKPPTRPSLPPAAETFRVDNMPNTRPSVGPTTRVAMPQASIKSLEVYEQDSGLLLGQTSEVVLTVTRDDDVSALTTVQFVTPIGVQMRRTRDEALRYIHVNYPNWNADRAEISFEDKYVPHEGGSIGAAVGTLLLSVIQGFQIDPDVAITGDISANGKVRAIGGVYAKLHGAIDSKCSLAVIPMDNYGQLVDAVIYNGSDLVTDVQVIGISSLDDAVATVRSNRDPKLVQAITLFKNIPMDLAIKPTDLNTKDIQQKLAKVLELAPQHLSARILISKAQGKLPKNMSAGASEYFTFVAIYPMVDLLAQRRDSSDPIAQIPSVTLQAGLKELQKLGPISDPKIRPLQNAWAAYIQAWTAYQQGSITLDAALQRWQIMDDETKKIGVDSDLMQKMLKEGI